MWIGNGMTIMRCGASSVTAESLALPVIQDGHSPSWLDSQDLTTITKDGSQHVTLWKNKLLVAAGDLDIVVGTPHWSTNGILFDGITDYMQGSFTLIQPAFIYMVLRQVTWTSGDRIMDGALNPHSAALIQQTSTPNLAMYAGALACNNANLAVNTWGIIRALWYGASSKLIINANSVTGSVGTATLDGLTIGAGQAGANAGNVEFKEIIVRNIADSSGDETLIYNYLKAKYAL